MERTAPGCHSKMDKPIVIAEFALVVKELGARPDLVYISKGLVGPLHPEEIDKIMGKVRDLLVEELVKGGVLVAEGVTIQ